jgi:inactive phospholipase C-like protein 2
MSLFLTYAVDRLVIVEKFRTKTVEDNGFNPQFSSVEASSQEKNKFRFQTQINYSSLTFLRFAVKDKDVGTTDDLIGTFATGINHLQTGYRHVPLWSRDGETDSHGFLFVYIEKKVE